MKIVLDNVHPGEVLLEEARKRLGDQLDRDVRPMAAVSPGRSD